MAGLWSQKRRADTKFLFQLPIEPLETVLRSRGREVVSVHRGRYAPGGVVEVAWRGASLYEAEGL